MRLKVKGLISNIPDSVDVNIDTLDLGQSIKIKQINIPNIDILDSKDNAIVTVKMTRNVVKEEAAPAKK
jgi:large subunit ribosomal protein L25